MTNFILSDEQIDAGYQQFLDQNPHIQTYLEQQTQEVAKILGVELCDLHRQVIHERLEIEATSLGIDSFEHLLKFIDITVEERQKILLARNEKIINHLGT